MTILGGLVDAFQELETVFQAFRRDVLAQRQILQLHRFGWRAWRYFDADTAASAS